MGTKNIKLAFFLNFAFTIFELVGGLLTNSIALLSDAIHDLGDSLSLGVSWYLEHLSKKKPTRSFSYGYGRFSVLGGLITSIILMIGIGFILVEAVPRILSPEPVDAPVVLLFAVAGVLVNGYAAYKTSHGTSINERVISLHLLEDVLGWAVLLVVSGVMSIWDVPILDPLLSVLYSLIIAVQVLKNLKKMGLIFLQGYEHSKEEEELIQHLRKDKRVLDIHHLHYWTLDGTINFITLHALMDDSITTKEHQEILAKLKHELMDLDYQHITIETEFTSCEERDCHPQISHDVHHHHHH